MFGSDIIEVAIGMAFLYLFMSMIASALREALEAFLKDRATDLERGIKEMLRTGAAGGANPPSLLDRWRRCLPCWLVGQWQPAGPASMAGALYDHPLVSSLYQGSYADAQGTGDLPSYIPKENFAVALLDIVAAATTTGQHLSIATLQNSLAGVANPNAVQRAVLLALSTAGNDLDNVKKGIEDWYDSTMQRVTGWYAKRTAGILFVLGLGAAVFLNVDSITIAKRLISDPTLRQAIVKQAETYAQKTSSPDTAKSFKELRDQFGEIGYPIGWTRYTDGYLYPVPQSCTVDQDDAQTGKKTYNCGSEKDYVATILLAFMGWLITAIAIMLGAPFWFDLLKKLISLRTSINPDEDAEKDAKNQGKGNKLRRRGNQGQGGGGQAGGGNAGGGNAGGGAGG